MMSSPTPPALRLGLLGFPLSHSLSPRLHAAAMQALNLPGTYQLCPVPPLPDGAPGLEKLMDEMRHGSWHGLNVTIPHKQAVIPLLDELTPVAHTIGAVNTIYRAGDRLVGDNTDAPGFLADLERVLRERGYLEKKFRSASRKALIMGAGGSARAVAYALAQAGWSVSVAARRLEQAQELASGLSGSFAITPLHLSPASLPPLPPGALIVNTTPVGMAPQVGASPWPAEKPLPPLAVVYDLVYNPPDTALLQAARGAGLTAAGGLGMLVEQAALAFERWMNIKGPRQAMRQAADDWAGQNSAQPEKESSGRLSGQV